MTSASAEGASVVALGGADGNEGRLRSAGIEFRSVPVGKAGVSPAMDLRLMVGFVKQFRRERPDVVHCFTIKPAIYGTLAAWLCAVPIRVVTITGLGHAFTSAPNWLNRLVRVLYRIALARAHLVYFQNPSDRDFFVAAGIVSASRAKLCAGTGVDANRFPLTELPVSKKGGAPQFLMISRLIREKGVMEFIRAAAVVQEQYPSARFSLLGGEDRRNPSALTEAEMAELKSSVVEWLGGTDDVRPYICQFDVVVLPSYREGLPRSLLEAAAMGRPAIASDAVGCRDVVLHGTTGYLVPVKDVLGLADAMRLLITNPLRISAMGEAARAHVVAHFDERAVIDATLSDYGRLLGKRVKDVGTVAAG